MNPNKISAILTSISEFVGSSPDALAVTIAARTRNPYATLVSTILSTRTKDEVTQVVTPQILALASTPQQMVALSEEDISKAIYPTSFYRVKAKMLQKVSQQLLDEYDGQVPDDLDKLIDLYGIGRKCANLILTLGFGKSGICVDTHVHRISNRLGFVHTKTPEKTEAELRKTLPKRWWIDINGVLIAFGRTHCTPISPKCTTCPVRKKCRQIGVGQSR
jgi:endonuclease-3